MTAWKDRQNSAVGWVTPGSTTGIEEVGSIPTRAAKTIIMSNTFKGTPGPWSLKESIIKGTDLTIDILAKFEHGWGDWVAMAMQKSCCNGTDETVKANAQLISCAPDMLEALSHCVEVLKQMPIASEYVETVGNMCMNYEALITRATTI